MPCYSCNIQTFQTGMNLELINLGKFVGTLSHCDTIYFVYIKAKLGDKDNSLGENLHKCYYCMIQICTEIQYIVDKKHEHEFWDILM